MSWTDKIPPWLPPLPPPRRGKGLIIAGLVVLLGCFIYIIVLGALGGTHTLLTLVPVLVGLALLITGLVRRNSA